MPYEVPWQAYVALSTNGTTFTDKSSGIKSISPGGGDLGYAGNHHYGSRTPKKTVGPENLRTLEIETYVDETADSAHDMLKDARNNVTDIYVRTIILGNEEGNEMVTTSACTVVSNPRSGHQAGSNDAITHTWTLVYETDTEAAVPGA